MKGGDDARVVVQGGVDSDPSVAPPHVQETKLFGHELGHNLGLDHGGGNATDNQAPNYQSVMNYRYQNTLALASSTAYHFDYSREAVPLDEPTLYEAEGLRSTLALADRKTVTWDCPAGSLRTTGRGEAGEVGGVAIPLDWDCNGVKDPPNVSVPVDISGRDGQKLMPGYDDWDALHQGKACRLQGRRDWVGSGEPYATDANLHPLEWLQATVVAAPGCSQHQVPLDDVVAVEVVAYADASWAAADVEPSRTRFAGAAPIEATVSDRDGDGDDDVTFWFRPSDMQLMVSASAYGMFNAHLTDGRALYAEPAISPGTNADADRDGVLDVCAP